MREQHRFKSYFPEHDGNMIKWYVDGLNYYWVSGISYSMIATVPITDKRHRPCQ